MASSDVIRFQQSLAKGQQLYLTVINYNTTTIATNDSSNNNYNHHHHSENITNINCIPVPNYT